MIFFFVLTVGFVYEFGSGALYFTNKRSEITKKTVLKNDNTTKNFPFINSFHAPKGRLIYSSNSDNTSFN